MLESDLVKECQNFAKSDAIKELFKKLDEKYAVAWKASALTERDQREFYYFMTIAIAALRTELDIVAQSTKVSEWNQKLQRLQV